MTATSGRKCCGQYVKSGPLGSLARTLLESSRWLREVYHIYITPQPTMQGWMFDLFDLRRHQYILCGKYVYAGSYEEALEEGMEEALELIIKIKRNEKDII